MNASRDRTFLYHASANPIGGRIKGPVEQVFAPNASTALAQAGGHAAASADAQKIDHPDGGSIISFTRAYSEVSGDPPGKEGGYWTTSVRSVVEGFNLLDLVCADKIEAYIKVRHPRRGGHPYISFEGTHFDNLKIGKHAVKLDLDLKSFSRSENAEPLERSDSSGVVETLAAGAVAEMSPVGPTVSWVKDKRTMGAARAHNRTLLKAASDDRAWVHDRYKGRTDAKKGRVVCSLVKRLSFGKGAPPYKSYGHIIEVPDVGNLFLAELSVRDAGFRLTMIRAEMGCKAEGDMSAAYADSDGRSIP